MKLVPCPEAANIRSCIENFELKGGVHLPLDVGQNIISNGLDVWKPPVPNDKSKIEVERKDMNSRIEKKYRYSWNTAAANKIPVANEIFCDILRFTNKGSCFSYKFNSKVFIRDRYMSEALFRSMSLGYIIGRFAFCGIGNSLSFAAREVY
jgi:hypothetical protein